MATKPVPAPAPPPAPPPDRPGLGGGFNPKGHRVLIELLVIGALLLAAGVLAVRGSGAVASALTPIVPTSVDEKLGAIAELSLVARDCPNPAAQRYVEELGRSLLAAAPVRPFAFRFRAVDDPSVNAFALPGGLVIVNRGLLESAETGEEVAGVLGHEIQHALLRHGTRRTLREMGGSIALSSLFGGSDLKGYAEVGSRLTGLKYGRAEESEADREGIALLLRANIDPSGLARFFERLSKDSATPPELLSTHPDPGNRAAEIGAARLLGPARSLPKPNTIRCEAK